ncbi:hypothetical protein ACFQH3_11735 [Haladaptatus sp. GCM10025707]|uniref:hypothetical protein n=1 Tax=unclassified Haladaptatus TaxID=2622732 RepID=UPI0023E8ECDA|nr:hypothetical protein [Haladaptatus sp. QDMS2]
MKSTLLTILVVCALLAPTTALAQEDTFISVTGATVTPEQPGVADLVTVTATIRNSAGSQQAFEVTAVSLEAREGSTRYDRVEDLGTLSPGESLAVPLTVTFEDAGVKKLEVEVRGRSTNGSGETIRYPVTIDVRESVIDGSVPRLQIVTGSPVSNTESTYAVRVSNGGEATLRDLELTLSGSAIAVEDAVRVVPRLEPGQLLTFNFTVENERAGQFTTAAELSYTVGDDRRTVSATRSVTVEPLVENVVVEASVQATEDTVVSPPVTVSVLNLGNAPIENVVVTAATQDGLAVARTLIPVVAAESAGSATLDLTGVTDPTDLIIQTAYETGTVSGTSETTLRYTPRVGVVALTGINTEFEDGTLHITGSASNVGQGPAESVVVRVVPADGVTPAQPFREYFVGTVPESDFVVFDLYAEVDEGVTMVPVSVTYLAGGEERTETVQVRVEGNRTANDQQTGGGLDLPLILGGVFIVLLVAGVVGYAWRNSRDGAR